MNTKNASKKPTEGQIAWLKARLLGEATPIRRGISAATGDHLIAKGLVVKVQLDEYSYTEELTEGGKRWAQA